MCKMYNINELWVHFYYFLKDARDVSGKAILKCDIWILVTSVTKRNKILMLEAFSVTSNKLCK